MSPQPGDTHQLKQVPFQGKYISTTRGYTPTETSIVSGEVFLHNQDIHTTETSTVSGEVFLHNQGIHTNGNKYRFRESISARRSSIKILFSVKHTCHIMKSEDLIGPACLLSVNCNKNPVNSLMPSSLKRR